jgi:hypothetical protein
MVGGIAFGDVARAIASTISLADGRPRLKDDDLVAHARAIAALDAPARLRVAEDLLIQAQRMWTANPDAWQDALAQLCVLVAVALGSAEAAAASFERGLGADRARAVVGAARSLKPPPGARVEGVLSPLAARIARDKPRD